MPLLPKKSELQKPKHNKIKFICWSFRIWEQQFQDWRHASANSKVPTDLWLKKTELFLQDCNKMISNRPKSRIWEQRFQGWRKRTKLKSTIWKAELNHLKTSLDKFKVKIPDSWMKFKQLQQSLSKVMFTWSKSKDWKKQSHLLKTNKKKCFNKINYWKDHSNQHWIKPSKEKP